jgi:hypothetical protein
VTSGCTGHPYTTAVNVLSPTGPTGRPSLGTLACTIGKWQTFNASNGGELHRGQSPGRRPHPGDHRGTPWSGRPRAAVGRRPRQSASGPAHPDRHGRTGGRPGQRLGPVAARRPGAGHRAYARPARRPRRRAALPDAQGEDRPRGGLRRRDRRGRHGHPAARRPVGPGRHSPSVDRARRDRTARCLAAPAAGRSPAPAVGRRRPGGGGAARRGRTGPLADRAQSAVQHRVRGRRGARRRDRWPAAPGRRPPAVRPGRTG